MKKNFLTQSRKKLLTQSEKKLLDIHNHAVTKRQKDILGCFGMDADMVKLRSEEIGSILTTQKRKKGGN